MADAQLLNPPAGSTLTIDVRSDGLTLRVPRQPIRKASKGTFGFAVLWLGFCGLITGFFLLHPLFGVGESDVDYSDWKEVAMLLGFAAVFWGVGIAILLAAINAARREVILDVVGDHLIATRSSLFGTRQDERTADDITLIHRGSTGTEVNGVPIQALQIESRSTKRLQLLAHLSDDEIDFVVDLLRRALRVTAVSPIERENDEPGPLDDEP
ncbi:MAG: hypothetical protein AAF842_02960 [Planctomycetota bacterium]